MKQTVVNESNTTKKVPARDPLMSYDLHLQSRLSITSNVKIEYKMNVTTSNVNSEN